MDFEYIIIGLIFIISGVFIIIGYEKLIKKFRVGGIGFVIIGAYLIVIELIKT